MTEEIKQLIEAEKNESPVYVPPVPTSVGQGEQLSNVTAANSFTKAVDTAKINVLQEASANDKKFTEDFKDKLKEATLKLAEVEREKANLEKQNIEYHQEILETQQLLNEQKQAEDKWNNRQKSREYHYAGVRPIMEFVGIKSAMNIFLLYSLTLFLLPFFLFAKLWKGTIGALIAGASDSDRPKTVRGFIWTVIGVVFAATVALGVYLVLKWLGVPTAV